MQQGSFMLATMQGVPERFPQELLRSQVKRAKRIGKPHRLFEECSSEFRWGSILCE